jgi:ABC-type Na+ efflux pump permease subunit
LPIGCLVLIFALLSPRLALFVLFLFSDLLSRAFDSWIVPLLGFFLLPWTTLAYAAMWASSDGVSGFEWFIVVLAFLIDVGAFAGGSKRRRETA